MALSIADYDECAFSGTGTDRATVGTLTWSAGDLVIVIAGVEDSSFGLNTPTFSGGTFTAIGTQLNAGSQCYGHRWQCTPASGGTDSVTGHRSDGNTGIIWGMAVWVFNGHNGIGVNSGTQGTSGQASLTVAANSAVVGAMFDWEADATGYTGTPTVSTEREDAAVGSNYAVWAADWLAQSAGTRSYGVASEASVALTLILVEVLESAGAPAAASTPQVVRTSRMVYR